MALAVHLRQRLPRQLVAGEVAHAEEGLCLQWAASQRDGVQSARLADVWGADLGPCGPVPVFDQTQRWPRSDAVLADRPDTAARNRHDAEQAPGRAAIWDGYDCPAQAIPVFDQWRGLVVSVRVLVVVEARSPDVAAGVHTNGLQHAPDSSLWKGWYRRGVPARPVPMSDPHILVIGQTVAHSPDVRRRHGGHGHRGFHVEARRRHDG